MVLQRMLLQLALVGVLVLVAAAPASAQAKPGCQDTCGNVSIPYPFGTIEGCYHDADFLITCNETLNGTKPFIRRSNIEVTNISVHGQVRIMADIAYDCYDKSANSAYYSDFWLNLAKFSISSTRNKFVVIGCDTYAYLRSYQGGKEHSSGCMLICDNIDYVSNGSCSGIGCCQTSIAEGMSYYKVELNSYDNYSGVWNFNPCGYAFVVEEGMYNFSVADLSGLKVQELPVVLEWAIGNKTCEVALKNSTAYACMNNSKCYDTIGNGTGYRCSCLEGYQGNPYLPSGCQDIDECKDGRPNQCAKVCINTSGNYTYSCPKGYHGDGRKDGNGCIEDQSDQSLVIKIVLGIDSVSTSVGKR